ncbi:MAG: glycosyltransferase [Tannerellaceae bacterium]
MKIIHYIPGIDRTSGGTTAYMQLLAQELGKLVELHIVSHASNNSVEIKNCKIHYIDSSLLKGMKKEWLGILNEIQPDVVHVNCCWMPQCAFAQKWAQESGYKVILTPHGMLEPWIMKRHHWTRKVPALLLYQKQAVVNADYLHATADSERKNLLNLGYNNKIEVIANGIEVEHIALKESWKRRKEILFLSRVHIKKGINFLIEAVAALRNELQGYVINIAGEGEESYINELKQLSAQMGIAEQVRFTGGVYGNQKWELFKNADLFVLPTYSENFGIVVAEALACGTPVITTKGTPWQELETCHCGWWTEIGTTATIKALKDFLASTDTELEVMGRNGRQLVQEKYSSKIIAEDMVELYKKTIEN